MNATKDKLGEALFFLQQLEVHHMNLAFDYYLSAFISSARSVLWVMRSEYHDVDGWETWYESRKPTSEEELLLKKINDIRVYSEKKSPLKTKFQILFTIPRDRVNQELRVALEKLPLGKKIRVTVKSTDDEHKATDTAEDDSLVRFAGKLDKLSRALQNPSEEDLLLACRKYYALLEQIILECQTRFH